MPRSLASILPLVLLALLLTARLSAQTLPATQPSTRPTADYHVLHERPDRLLVQLDNGLIVIAQQLPTAPVVSAQVYVKTGSIYEQEHVGAGLSHFLEHLLSAGSTSTRGEEESNAILARIGANTNASTSLDNVRYYVNTTKAHAGEAIGLLSDWMRHSLISDAEYRRERDVIQREFEMGEGEPARIYWKLTQQVRHRTHPARHPTIGYLDEFLRISRDEIYAFYKRMYVPNNMVFVVTGDIDKDAVVEQVARLWAGAEPGELPDLAFPVEPEIDGPREAAGFARMERPLPRLRLAWPGTRLGAEHDYALDLLAVVLGQGESSRLVRSVRDQARAVYGVSAFNLSHPWGEGFFGIDSEVAVPPPPGSMAADLTAAEWNQRAVERAKGLILAEAERLRKEGVTPEELARAKRETLARVLYEGQTAEDVAERLASDMISTGDPDYLRRYVKEIEKLTEKDLLAAANKYLTPRRLLTITLLPLPEGQKPQPLARPADAAIDKTGPVEKADLDNGALVAKFRAAKRDAGEAAPLTIGPTQRFVLPNGLRVLVQRSNVVPAVAMQLYQLGGLLADEPGREGVANAAAVMQMRGTKTRTAQQIAEALENLGADMGSSAGNQTSFVRAVSLKQDWPTVLELLADVSLNPGYPQDEWDRMRPRLVAGIHRQKDQWSGLLNSHFRKAYFGDHVWSETTAGKAEVVERLTPEDLRAFHATHAGASQTVLAVFGDVDPAQVKATVESLFAAMPAKPQAAVAAVAPPPPQTKLSAVKTSVPPAAAQIGFGPGPTRTSPDYAAVQVMSRVLSSFPTGWLDTELRGRGPGLVYAVWGYPMTGLVPGFYAVGFNANPAAVPEAVARSMGVVERIKGEPVDADTLAHAKSAVLTDEFFGKQSNGDRATEAALNELYGLGLDEPARFLKAVEATTAERVREVARKYLRNPVAVVISHQPVPEESLQAALRGEAPAAEVGATQPASQE